MNITIISVGKIKEKYITEGIAEYCKRLSRYCKLTMVEVPDEKTPDNASDKENELIKEAEGQLILAKIPNSKNTTHIIALDIQGKMSTSEQFAKSLSGLALDGKSNIVFVIGGSLGLSTAVKLKADTLFSFSKMTFPHQLFKLILLEQVYRAFRIIANEPYHK